ncbi:hypothetical protein BJ508DRAFT_307538 [Ascobolus immersus RN42]|uniref:Uncharacterized protein n=1 Tax=Ascobolus immersus RN42 TaxID=1160509 RepID=A0A3N4I2J4_ASCIM|nr:hypothetical protein BJ508DRAFT_307538 [Ascobolus immersus RN42]
MAQGVPFTFNYMDDSDYDSEIDDYETIYELFEGDETLIKGAIQHRAEENAAFFRFPVSSKEQQAETFKKVLHYGKHLKEKRQARREKYRKPKPREGSPNAFINNERMLEAEADSSCGGRTGQTRLPGRLTAADKNSEKNSHYEKDPARACRITIREYTPPCH